MKRAAACLLALLLFAPRFSTNCAQAAEGSPDADAVKTTVAEVLADPEYRHLQRGTESSVERSELPDWLRRFLEWLFGDSEPAEPSEPLLQLRDVLLYGALGILIVFLIVVAVRILGSRGDSIPLSLLQDAQDEEALSPSHPPGDVPTNEYERRALAAAASQNYRAALRELVLGSMSWTERSGLIRYRSGLTNRDYVRAVWSQTGRRDSLLQIVAAFERVFYGRRIADLATYELCLAEFRQSFAYEEIDAQPTS